MYDQAITYLEKASEIEPANALISDHLGDAYWQGNRKNEARFQWNHALSLKDDSGELSIKEVKQKLKKGLTTNEVPPFNVEAINERIETITKD